MKKLYRSQTDKKISGLCGGVAEYLNIDSTLLRVLVIVATFFSAGSIIPIYIIACLVIPKEPKLHNPGMFGAPGYPGGGYYGQHQHNGYNAGSYGPQSFQGTNPNNGPQPFVPTHSYTGHAAPGPAPQAQPTAAAPNEIDDMMKDIEKKALFKEIEQLREKIAKYEKGEQPNGSIPKN